jgi:heat shock protein HslJ
MMKKITASIIALILITLLALSACAAQAGPSSLPGSSWTLVSYGTAGKEIPAAQGIPTSLVFGKDGQVSGELGCSSFSGSYQVQGGNLVLGPLASTLKACPDPQMMQEGTAFQVLTGTVRFTLDDGTLTITAPGGMMLLIFSQVKN